MYQKKEAMRRYADGGLPAPILADGGRAAGIRPVEKKRGAPATARGDPSSRVCFPFLGV